MKSLFSVLFKVWNVVWLTLSNANDFGVTGKDLIFSIDEKCSLVGGEELDDISGSVLNIEVLLQEMSLKFSLSERFICLDSPRHLIKSISTEGPTCCFTSGSR